MLSPNLLLGGRSAYAICTSEFICAPVCFRPGCNERLALPSEMVSCLLFLSLQLGARFCTNTSKKTLGSASPQLLHLYTWMLVKRPPSHLPSTWGTSWPWAENLRSRYWPAGRGELGIFGALLGAHFKGRSGCPETSGQIKSSLSLTEVGCCCKSQRWSRISLRVNLPLFVEEEELPSSYLKAC